MEAAPTDDVYTNLKALVRLRHSARGFSYLPQQPLRSLLAGRKRSRLRGRGLDFDELRHYRPGDDIRTMDWRVTNRTGKPHVRVYTEERDRPALLLADEPTGNLDPATSDQVFDTLMGLVRGTGLCAVIATHNHDLARRMDRRVVLQAGRLI